jgi:hypothetical protein
MLDRLIANQAASRGRYGDSSLVHMAPEEINGLQALAEANGTSMTINPYTGYPEAFSLKKVFKSVGNAVGNVLKPIAKVLQPIAPILPFLPIPGIGPLSALAVKSILGGALGGMGKDGKFDFKRALLSGGMQYGIGSLMQGLGSASAATTPATPTPAGPISNIDPGMLEGMSKADVANFIDKMPVTGPVPAGPDFGPGVMMDPATGNVLPPAAPPSPVGGFQQSLPSGSGPMDYLKQTGSNIMEAGKGVGSFFTDPAAAYEGFKAGLPMNPFTNTPISPFTAVGTAVGGALGVKSIDDLNAMKNQAQQILDNPATAQREEDIEWAKGVLRDFPIAYRNLTEEDVRNMDLGGRGTRARPFAGGGIASLQNAVNEIRQEYGFAGGGQARFLSGGGDGMSDSIPATIANRQPARLADGEFVIPADVVSHVGNGSSKAGAKKLYAMMDRVRKARTGKKRQAPSVRAERYMPA